MPNQLINQAFKTAVDLFEVVSENGKIDVVVEYYEKARVLIEKLGKSYLTVTE